ncbi:hypothetical protein Sjap_011913 [Stephania japonica]|uniref:Xylanase inhibitor C-terminal domain-containing protein n=1 Tax=Stephania japonica TaxID=461633 RepID=A0AAP0P8H4_9MAGN
MWARLSRCRRIQLLSWLKRLFKLQTKLSVADDDRPYSSRLDIDLCFNLPSDGISNTAVPSLIFHFEGADMELPLENYTVSDVSAGLTCLAMEGSSGNL